MQQIKPQKSDSLSRVWLDKENVSGPGSCEDKQIEIVKIIYSPVLSPCTVSEVLIVSQVALKLQKGQQYAMKKVVKRKLSQVQRDLVLKEANTLAALSHENIVRLYRSNESDSESVMLLEWCDRPHYFEQKIIKNQQKLRTLVHQILSALAYIHSQGFVHCDIKPSNIALHRKSARLIDFGAAHQLDLNGEGQLVEPCGTLGYLAPEITNKSSWPVKVTAAIDLWAFGIVLFELTVGFNPTLTQRSHNISFGKAWDHKDPLLLDLVRGCLKSDPTQRITAKSALTHPLFTQQ